jgi:hypothetical protein
MLSSAFVKSVVLITGQLIRRSRPDPPFCRGKRPFGPSARYPFG